MRLQMGIIFIFTPLWFALHMVLGVEITGRITYEQTEYTLYFLGIIFAQFSRFTSQSNASATEDGSNDWLESLNKANKDILILATVLFAIVFVTKDKGISRIFLSNFLITLWPMLALLYRFLPKFISNYVFGKNYRFKTAIIGGTNLINSIDSLLYDFQRSGFELKGLISIDANAKELQDSPYETLGSVENIETIFDKHQIDQVVVLESIKSREWFNRIFRACDAFGVHVLVYNFWQEYFDQPVHFTKQGVHTYFSFQEEPLQSPFSRIVKRLFDIVVSLPVVVLVLPPLCLWVKLVQMRQAPGPLFFKQERTGLQKHRFGIYKFRSMYAKDSTKEKEAKQATPGDSRIYPFGAFMRNRSIDEFPQFLNILKGDMSLVGPRPHLIQHDELFQKSVSTYRIRHFVKPGLTGLAQVNGFRGEVTSEELINARVRYDIAYINSWSIWLDIDLVIKTFSELLYPSQKAY